MVNPRSDLVVVRNAALFHFPVSKLLTTHFDPHSEDHAFWQSIASDTVFGRKLLKCAKAHARVRGFPVLYLPWQMTWLPLT